MEKLATKRPIWKGSNENFACKLGKIGMIIPNPKISIKVIKNKIPTIIPQFW